MTKSVRLGTPRRAILRANPLRDTRSVGNMPEVEVDILNGPTRSQDVWVLGTDGMTQVFDQTRIAEIVTSASNAQEAAEKMVEIAVEEDGSDNVSVVVVRCT